MSAEDATMTIRGFAMRCRSLAGAGPEMARRTAEIMREETVASIAKQQSVDGVKWAPRKDGGIPLANSPDALSAHSEGNVAVLTLTGVEVFHHYGAGRNPRRAILPSKGVDKLGIAIRRGIVTLCDEFMTRDGRHDKGGGGKSWTPKTGRSK
jgi:hypothetical protein